MEYDDLLELVKNRRSIRRFKPDPIPDADIDKIIDVASWAPSGFNMQPWEFVVVRKPALKEKIVEYMQAYSRERVAMEIAREPWQGKRPSFDKKTGVKDGYPVAPVFIILYGDSRTQDGLPMALRYTPDRRHLIHTAGLATAFIYMHLAATSLGLASQWVSGITTPYAHCMVGQLLGIPKTMVPYDMMALGYPAITPNKKLLRDPEKMIHYDDCGVEDFRSDDEVRDFVKKARNWNVGTHDRKGDNEKK